MIINLIFFKKLSCTVQCTLVHTYVYVYIKQLSLCAAVVENRSITASVLGVSYLIGGFVASYDIQGVSPTLKL